MFGPRNSAYAVNLTYRHTYILYIHISREISIEHPSVGLASLAQLLRKDCHAVLQLRYKLSVLAVPSLQEGK